MPEKNPSSEQSLYTDLISVCDPGRTQVLLLSPYQDSAVQELGKHCKNKLSSLCL